VSKVDEVIPVKGVVIHSQRDWPCSRCRPLLNDAQGSTFLCVKCAISLTAASIRQIPGRPGASLGESSTRDSETDESTASSGWIPPALWEPR
jgi:hypothetical protein